MDLDGSGALRSRIIGEARVGADAEQLAGVVDRHRAEPERPRR
jgi:hypothetical protein